MKTKTTIKAGGIKLQHNEAQAHGMKVRTSIKAGLGGGGGIWLNHNENISARRG